MKIEFKNPLEVNENDTLGTAILKGAVEGYVKGVLAAGAGLAIFAVGVSVLSSKVEEDSEPEKEEETEEDVNEQLQKNLDELTRIRKEREKMVDSI